MCADIASEVYDEDYHKPQPYSSWPQQGVNQLTSPTGQKFFLEANVKNAENIQQLTLDQMFIEICPAWKPTLAQGQSLFASGMNTD